MMHYKWIGALIIITGCGGFGFAIASGYRQTMKRLRQLIHALTFMDCELQYRLTPLPELCRQTGREVTGQLRDIFTNLAMELDHQTAPDVSGCMTAALKRSPDPGPILRRHLVRLGHILGRFDLSGQLKGISSVKTACVQELHLLENDQHQRIRCYQTLGLCAGAALVILFV